MNYYERHIGDYLKDTSHLSLLEHGIYGRLLDVYYTREGAIPDAQAARLIGARSKEEREALSAVLSEFFELIDGHWHQGRCDAEIEEYQSKQADKPAAKDNAKERQRRARERRAQLFEALRSHGVTLPYKATTAELEAELSRVLSHSASRNVTRDASRGVTRDDTATQTPVPSPQSPEESNRHTEYISCDDESPSSWEAWRQWFESDQGLTVDPYSTQDRAKFRPLAQGWVNARLTVGQMRKAIAKAKSEAKEAIAYMPSYVDRVLTTLSAPPKALTQSELNAMANGGFGTGMYGAFDPTPVQNQPETIDVESRLIAP